MGRAEDPLPTVNAPLCSLYFFSCLLVILFAPDRAISQSVISPPPSAFITSFTTGNEEPIRVAMDGYDVLYVAAPYAGKILKFRRDGRAAGVIAGFRRPLSVAVDAANRVYVGEQGGSVQVVSPSGAFLFSLGKGEGEFSMPGDIAVGNNHIYVADSSKHVVKAYQRDGSFSFSFGGYGVNPGQMIFPAGVAVDDDYGEVYVVDHNNGRVEVFSPDGSFRRSFGSLASGPGQLTRPQGISVSKGKVFVADAFQSRIQVYTREGNYLESLGAFGREPGGLTIPMDVVVSNYRIYVSNSDGATINVFDVASLFDFLAGDVNGNGTVGLEDAILALRIVAGMPVKDVAGDVDNDGKIGLVEALYALRRAAGIGVSR